MNRFYPADFFDFAARDVNTRKTLIVSDDVSRVYNYLRAPADRADAFVFAVPHISRAGLGYLGLTDEHGRRVRDLPMHRVTDVHLGRLTHALAARSGYTFVGSKFSRLVFNGAVPESLAVLSHTPDGMPIPAYQTDFETKRETSLALYRNYIAMMEQQISRGSAFIGSLDTFTPERLRGDIGEQRDMAVSIIAKNARAPHVQELQQKLSQLLTPSFAALRDVATHPLSIDEVVAINKPYGEQAHHRLDALQRGGITIEVRNDLLRKPLTVELIAAAIHEAVAGIYAPPPQERASVTAAASLERN